MNTNSSKQILEIYLKLKNEVCQVERNSGHLMNVIKAEAGSFSDFLPLKKGTFKVNGKQNQEGFTCFKCTKCGGNIYRNEDYYGWYMQCLQCSCIYEIESLAELPGSF